MEAFIDSYQVLKRFKKDSNKDNRFKRIDWIKIEQRGYPPFSSHIKDDRTPFYFSYAISNTKARPIVYTAIVQEGESQKYYKKLKRWIGRRYWWQKNVINCLAIIGIVVMILIFLFGLVLGG